MNLRTFKLAFFVGLALVVIGLLAITLGGYWWEPKIEPVELPKGDTAIAWDLAKGSALAYRIERSSTTTKPGSRMTASQNSIALDYAGKVLDHKPNGNFVAELSVQDMQLDVDAGEFKFQYDTKTAPTFLKAFNNPILYLVSGFMKKSIEIEVAPNGNLSKLRGFDRIRKGSLSSFGDTAGARTTLGPMFEMFSKDSFARMLQSSFAYLPNVPVSEGQSWLASTIVYIPMIGLVAVNVECTLQRSEKCRDSICRVVKYQGELGLTSEPFRRAWTPDNYRYRPYDIGKVFGSISGSFSFMESPGQLYRHLYRLTVDPYMRGKVMGGQRSIGYSERVRVMLQDPLPQTSDPQLKELD